MTVRREITRQQHQLLLLLKNTKVTVENKARGGGRETREGVSLISLACRYIFLYRFLLLLLFFLRVETSFPLFFSTLNKVSVWSEENGKLWF
ncbi:hypothetical protein V6N13_039086 [Hibiscus sabdariffa]